METSTRKYETVLSNPDVTCEIVKKDDGYLHVVCTKCKAACTLFPRKQSRSLSGGEARDFYANHLSELWSFTGDVVRIALSAHIGEAGVSSERRPLDG